MGTLAIDDPCLNKLPLASSFPLAEPCDDLHSRPRSDLSNDVPNDPAESAAIFSSAL